MLFFAGFTERFQNEIRTRTERDQQGTSKGVARGQQESTLLAEERGKRKEVRGKREEV